MTKKKDGTGASVNSVYFFRLETNSKNSFAKVVVHLHHTARKVQIQGGSLVNDKKRASIWFVENFLVPAFSEAAKTKAKDVKNFNNAVKDMVAKHVKKISTDQHCKSCEIIFTGRSQKQSCAVCNHKFHKKCFTNTNHGCIGAGPSNTHQASSISSTLHSDIPSIIDTLASLSSETNVSYVQQPSHSHTTTQQFQSLSPTSPSHSTPTSYHPQCVTTLETTTTVNHLQDPSQLSTHSSTVHDQATTHVGDHQGSDHGNDQFQVHDTPSTTQVNNTGKAKKASKHTPAIDTASFETECLRKQINIAHAKIQELETQLDTAKNTNFILGERIKTFEATNTKEVFERYFPRNIDTVESTAIGNQDVPTHRYHPPQQAHCCCPPPPCRASYCHPRSQDNGIGDIVRELSSKVNRLSNNIVNMKSEITNSITSMLTQQDKENSAPRDNAQVPPPPETLSDAPQPEHSPYNVSDNSNMSETNTINEHVPALSPQNYLNCLARTTQL